MTALTLLPPPVELGLPAKFSGWRPKQDHAVVRALDTGKRFAAMVMPTGSGKSLAAVAMALLNGDRAVYLTSTKGLQNQVARDFAETGMWDIRGQNNYPCLLEGGESHGEKGGAMPSVVCLSTDTPTCDRGPCHAGLQCDLKDGGCVYFDRVRGASKSPLVVTNYSYWMHQLEYGKGTVAGQGPLGAFGLLILDEAHAAPEELSSYLSVEFTHHDADLLQLDGIPDWSELGQWKAQAAIWSVHIRSEIQMRSEHVKATGDRKHAGHIHALKTLQKKLLRLSGMVGDWVFERVRRGPMGAQVVRFHPVWPADYAEKHLFAGIKKVLLASATVRPKTLDLLGVKADEVDFAEYPSVFPVRNRPVYSVDCVRVDKQMEPESRALWVSKIDSVIAGRPDRKGIIHTVSYERAHHILRHSAHGRLMLLHESRTTAEVVKRFRESPPPLVLVSPSMTTGYDFPGDQVRYQIVAKTPFPDTRDLVLQARCKRDKEYAFYLAMQTIVQMAGRAVRSEDDWCETIILDNNFGDWFWPRYHKFAASWFRQAVKKCNTIPSALQIK